MDINTNIFYFIDHFNENKSHKKETLKKKIE